MVSNAAQAETRATVARIVYRMSRTDFLNFREMAISGLFEATFYEYLYLGVATDEADGLKPSLKSALEEWWDEQHAYADPAVNSKPTRAIEKVTAGYFEETIEARSKMSLDGLRSSMPCIPNRRNAKQKRPVRGTTSNKTNSLPGAGAGSRRKDV